MKNTYTLLLALSFTIISCRVSNENVELDWPEASVFSTTAINDLISMVSKPQLASHLLFLGVPKKINDEGDKSITLLKPENTQSESCDLKGGIYKSHADYKANNLTDFGQFVPKGGNPPKYATGYLFFEQNGKEVRVKALKEKYYGFQHCDGERYRMIKNGLVTNYYLALVEGKACVYATGDVAVRRNETGEITQLTTGLSTVSLYYTMGIDSPKLVKLKEVLKHDTKLYEEYKKERYGTAYISESEFIYREIAYIIKYNAKHE